MYRYTSRSINASINEGDITFGEPIRDVGRIWKDVFYRNESIGALHQHPTDVYDQQYQSAVLEKDEYKDAAWGWGETEDDGYIFVMFPDIERFIRFHNKFPQARVEG